MSDFDSPLGLIIRPPDAYASEGGGYGAKRSRAGRARRHEGIDLLTIPGQPVVAPVACYWIRLADPYPNERDDVLLGGLLRTVAGIEIKILYFRPLPELTPGALLRRGQLIGYAQSLQHLYRGIPDHIHVEVYATSGDRVDPTRWFFSEEPGRSAEEVTT